MSYDPSHRRPPRQERWPNATPGEGWPAYQQGDGERSPAPADALAGGGNGYGTASNSSGTLSDGYGPPWGGRATTAGDTWPGRAPARYNEPASGYRPGATGYGADGYGVDGYAAGHEFSGPADYQEQEKYSALEPGVSSVLVAPDMLEEWWRQPEAGAG